MSKQSAMANKSLRGRGSCARGKSDCSSDHNVLLMSKIVFCAGDKLPENLDGVLKITGKGDPVCLAAGDDLPSDLIGYVLVDPSTGKSFYNPVQQPTILYKAGDTLPSFDGSVDVFIKPAGVESVYGSRVLPDTMIGVIICVDGELCYIGDEPIQLPDEIQIGGSAPSVDSGVEVWIDCGVTKYPTESGWVQTKPYGA